MSTHELRFDQVKAGNSRCSFTDQRFHPAALAASKAPSRWYTLSNEGGGLPSRRRLMTMSNKCPLCAGDLGELDDLQSELQSMMFGSSIEFQSACCNKPFLAKNKTGLYFVVPADNPDARPQMIGAR